MRLIPAIEHRNYPYLQPFPLRGVHPAPQGNLPVDVNAHCDVRCGSGFSKSSRFVGRLREKEFAHKSILARQTDSTSCRAGKEETVINRAQRAEAWRRPLAVAAIALTLFCEHAVAQNLGASPQTNVAVQGETGAQPEGAFLNFINWIGNVIAPVGAGGAVVGAIVSWLTGRGFGRWLFAAASLLLVSGVTRLIEFWIANGTGGVH